MKQDDIIRMARVAGVHDDGHRFEFSKYKYLERFANLVAAAKAEVALAEAYRCGYEAGAAQALAQTGFELAKAIRMRSLA